MKHLCFSACVLPLALIAGCDKSEATFSSTASVSKSVAPKDDHDHGAGPHGGTIVELDRYHGEFVVDHAKKQVTFYILAGNAKTPVPIAVESLQLSIKSPKFEVELKAMPQADDPKGKCSRFVATHDNFGKEQEFEGSVSFKVDDKPYVGDFQEKAHDHEHKK